MGKQETEMFLTKKIPGCAYRDAMRNVLDRTIAFSISKMPFEIFGTGVLVSVLGHKFILTARHVTDFIIESGYDLVIFLALQKSDQLICRLEDLDLKSYVFDLGKGPDEESGPDLSLIVLSPDKIESLVGSKSFSNLDLYRDSVLSSGMTLEEFRSTSFFIQGHPAENLLVDEKVGRFSVHNYTCFTFPSGYKLSEDGHDYLNFPVGGEYCSYPFPDSPDLRWHDVLDWGGVSGGGVWKMDLRRSEEGRIKFSPPILFGIAFYQRKKDGKAYEIKTHGPVSIYDMLYGKVESLRLP